MKPLDDLFTKKAEDSIFGAASPSVSSGAVGGVVGALAGPTVGGFVGSQIGAASKPSGDDKLRNEAVSELFDPSHEAELTRIRTQAMMSDFMSNDPVIATYDPEEVTDAYNQIVQLAPRAAQQPAIMRGLIRKMLQQQDALEPFEAGQVAQIEQSMKGLAEPMQPRLPQPPAARS
jgi:hypothetical protein